MFLKPHTESNFMKIFSLPGPTNKAWLCVGAYKAIHKHRPGSVVMDYSLDQPVGTDNIWKCVPVVVVNAAGTT
jgi:hypothetical protein